MENNETKNNKPKPDHAPTKTPAQSNQNPISQLEQIKSIIFGPEMEAINSIIRDLQEGIQRNREEFNLAIESLRSDLGASVDEVDQNFTKKLEKAEKEIRMNIEELNTQKADRKQIGQLLIQMGEEFLKEE